MKILITGASGQLGREIIRQGTNHEVIMTDSSKLDITDNAAVKEFMHIHKPETVINCAAYTNVDGAETNSDIAFRVNATGAQNLAIACQEIKASLVYISTDYVFDGSKTIPYLEVDPTNPQTVYGQSKCLGEEIVRQNLNNHFIVRTAWLYGNGNNFVRTMMQLAEKNTELRVVYDQIGTPTSTTELTKALFIIINAGLYGTYHATCQGQCSWYDFASEIFRMTGRNIKLIPVTTAEFPRPAKRPPYSVLDNGMLRKIVGDPFKLWQVALEDYLNNSDLHSQN